jgi:formylglycine-generating enzyme required for sulfatase activity
MGCVPEDEWCYDQERPRHQVSLGTGFWIGRTEVTAQAFERFAKGVGWSVPAAAGPSYPVTGIDWESARSFCAAAGGRLPTEAEWEMAARGGRDSLVYPGGNELTHEQANFLGVAGRDTWEELAPVASFPATGFGLYDMAGNAWEWVADWMDEEYYGRSPKIDPGGPSAGERRVVRGGSAENKPSHLRVSLRLADLPESGNAFKGFRCVLAAIPD